MSSREDVDASPTRARKRTEAEEGVVDAKTVRRTNKNISRNSAKGSEGESIARSRQITTHEQEKRGKED